MHTIQTQHFRFHRFVYFTGVIGCPESFSFFPSGLKPFSFSSHIACRDNRYQTLLYIQNKQGSRSEDYNSLLNHHWSDHKYHNSLSFRLFLLIYHLSFYQPKLYFISRCIKNLRRKVLYGKVELNAFDCYD